MARVRSVRAIVEKKTGAITYSMAWENEVSKMFIRSLTNWTELESTPQIETVSTLEYRLLNQPVTAHVVPESPNNLLDIIFVSTRQTVKNDMEIWQKSKQWPLSCYTYTKEEPSFPGKLNQHL